VIVDLLVGLAGLREWLKRAACVILKSDWSSKCWGKRGVLKIMKDVASADAAHCFAAARQRFTVVIGVNLLVLKRQVLSFSSD
jgi:hypothetical protein